MITELDLYRADADHLSAQYPDYLDPEAWTGEREAWEHWLDRHDRLERIY